MLRNITMLHLLKLRFTRGVERCLLHCKPGKGVGLLYVGEVVSEDKSKSEGPVIIKKYANRRLYNTQTSSYVTLDHLAAMVKDGTEFEVQDARTGDDITRSVLTQIIFEEEAKGQSLLPIKFLRQLIRFYGDSLQSFVPGYLDMSMEGFTKNQGAMRDRIAEALGGGNQMVENLTRQNLAMFENAMAMFTPFAVGGAAATGAAPPKSEPAEKPASNEVDTLKQEMEAMRKQLAELAKK
jgi:polyhydroxyalkanoate synthesis repressor PhaR